MCSTECLMFVLMYSTVLYWIFNYYSSRDDITKPRNKIAFISVSTIMEPTVPSKVQKNIGKLLMKNSSGIPSNEFLNKYKV